MTNIRNTKSSHWRRWLGFASRCLVPVNSFCEWADTKPRKTPTWFALDEKRPLFAFAGIWTTWTGVRGTKANPVDGEHRLYGFLTTDANGVVGPIHPKAMPVLLTTAEEYDVWLWAPWSEAQALQQHCLTMPCGLSPAGRARTGMVQRSMPSRNLASSACYSHRVGSTSTYSCRSRSRDF